MLGHSFGSGSMRRFSEDGTVGEVTNPRRRRSTIEVHDGAKAGRTQSNVYFARVIRTGLVMGAGGECECIFRPVDGDELADGAPRSLNTLKYATLTRLKRSQRRRG